MGFEPEFGVWEEGPEEHSSNYGAVPGGLMMWFDQGFYDYKYRSKINISDFMPVSERMIHNGVASLKRPLPAESPSRPYDLAQLSLIWPYNIVDFEMKQLILKNIETKLVGRSGVRCYPNDKYCGKGLVPHDGETAEWPLGLAWLSICYAKLAEHGADFDESRKPIAFTWTQRKAHFELAVEYFTHLERTMTTEGYVPEMYVGLQMGHNTPLAWAQSFHLIAGQSLLNLSSRHREHFKLPAEILGRGRG